MRRFVLTAITVVLALFGGSLALVAWVTREEPPPEAAAPPPDARSAEEERAAAPESTATAAPRGETPHDAAAPDPEESTARALFRVFRDGFARGQRSAAAEERVRPGLEGAFGRGKAQWTLECRRLLCRVAVAAPLPDWRERFTRHPLAQHLERIAFDPDGEQLAFLELVDASVADHPRPEGERILDEVEQNLVASDAARRCVAAGAAPEGAEVQLVIDRSGVTYRFDTSVDAAVGYCLMMEALPEVLATVSAPAGVRAAERKVRIPAD